MVELNSELAIGIFGNFAGNFSYFFFVGIEINPEMFGSHDLPVKTGILNFVFAKIELRLKIAGRKHDSRGAKKRQMLISINSHHLIYKVVFHYNIRSRRWVRTYIGRDTSQNHSSNVIIG